MTTDAIYESIPTNSTNTDQSKIKNIYLFALIANNKKIYVSESQNIYIYVLLAPNRLF